MSMSEDPLPTFTVMYTHTGVLTSMVIAWRGESIEVIPNPKNGPTRDLQRADEVIQALCAHRNQERRIEDVYGKG